MLYLKNGKILNGQLKTIAKDRIFFKSNDSLSAVQYYPKNEVVLIEKYNGDILAFAPVEQKMDTVQFQFKKNNISIQPFSFLLGRITANYEYILKNGKMGVMIPFSLTFDPVGIIYKSNDDSTSTTSNQHRSGVNFITGLDLNFYCRSGNLKGFFIGPRFRYGYDMLLRNIEGASLQTQIGYQAQNYKGNAFQSLSLGFGFVRILSSPAGNLINPKETFMWGSLNYKIGFGW